MFNPFKIFKKKKNVNYILWQSGYDKESFMYDLTILRTSHYESFSDSELEKFDDCIMVLYRILYSDSDFVFFKSSTGRLIPVRRLEKFE